MFGATCRTPEGQMHPCGARPRSVAASPSLPLIHSSTKTAVVRGLNAVILEVLLNVILPASRRDGSTGIPSPYLRHLCWTGVLDSLRVLARVLTVWGALALPRICDAGRVRRRGRRWLWRGRKGWDCVPANIE